MLTTTTHEMMNYFNLFSKNILPVAGGWLDQSAWFHAALTIINNEVAAYQENKSAKSAQEAKKPPVSIKHGRK